MKTTAFILSFIVSICALAQTDSEVAKTIDDLRYAWDEEAIKLESYEGLGNFCGESTYRKKIINMLDEIHHYDTLLYGIVTRKFNTTQDAEAKATIEDIETLEVDYTTLAFKRFVHKECNTYNEIENNLGAAKGKEYEKEVKALEEELIKYVDAITKRIDIIDEHVHHLDIGD